MVIDGKEADPKSFDIVVVNGDDGSWLIRVDGKEISKGASTFDATKQPKTIDFTPSEGGGKCERHLGIYEIAENTRKLCFAPTGQPRPDKFAAPAGSKRLLVRFERVKP
ncbi:MAG: TIGR03067 domain-containing protein [Planctomycetales bacterium]|nr:TIGR03067 domain-containing protein [Planctomycetales bacterium]